MTTHEQHIAQKKKEIEKIEKQQARLIKQMQKIAATPYKRPGTILRRIPKYLSIINRVRALDIEKQIIISMPLPKQDIGGLIAGNMAIFKESGPEIVTAGNFRIYPTSLVKRDAVVVVSENGTIDEWVFNGLKTSASGSS